MKNVKSNTRHFVITEKHLARKMNIVLEKDNHMMRATAQKGIQTAVHPITRRYMLYLLDLHTPDWQENGMLTGYRLAPNCWPKV